MMRQLPHQAVLRLLLDYDPETGFLTWRARPRGLFSCERIYRSWTARYAGQRAFTALRNGYPHGCIFKEQFAAHRIIWKWMTGEEPKIVDHINGTIADNRWRNLRSCSRQDNQRNMRRSGANTSGHTGVGKNNRGAHPWQAYIQANGKRVNLGTFDTLEAAIAARAAAEQEHGYHKNHGRPEPVSNARVIVSIG